MRRSRGEEVYNVFNILFFIAFYAVFEHVSADYTEQNKCRPVVEGGYISLKRRTEQITYARH